MEIAPLRGLRYSFERALLAAQRPEVLAAPPYDVIAPDEHRRLLASPYNITRLTLGDRPGEISSYEERARLLDEWTERGVLVRDDEPGFYVYRVDYRVPGHERRETFLGLVALGRVYPFEDRVVLRHEQTFSRVVDDRLRLLEATRANLESILLLYCDGSPSVDDVLEESVRGEPLVRIEAKPGELHELYPVGEGKTSQERAALHRRLIDGLRPERPIIADGHHRYTTALRFHQERGADRAAGSGWCLMTFASLRSSGVSILATHRLLKLAASSLDAPLRLLEEQLAPARGESWDLAVETVRGLRRFRVPEALRASRSGVAATTYALLHDVIIGDWLAPWTGPEPGIVYFKEGTGEREALREGKGDLLFLLRPVDRDEFRRVVEGCEVFPHKTTFFYPKLFSGLVLWRLEDPDAAARLGPAAR